VSEIHALNFVIEALWLDGIRRSAELKQAQVVVEPSIVIGAVTEKV
jgi:hypothetical protein